MWCPYAYVHIPSCCTLKLSFCIQLIQRIPPRQSENLYNLRIRCLKWACIDIVAQTTVHHTPQYCSVHLLQSSLVQKRSWDKQMDASLSKRIFFQDLTPYVYMCICVYIHVCIYTYMYWWVMSNESTSHVTRMKELCRTIQDFTLYVYICIYVYVHVYTYMCIHTCVYIPTDFQSCYRFEFVFFCRLPCVHLHGCVVTCQVVYFFLNLSYWVVYFAQCGNTRSV